MADKPYSREQQFFEMRLFPLVFAALMVRTSSVKFINLDKNNRVIVYSEPNVDGHWIYRNAWLYQDYHFHATDNDGQHYVALSSLVAPAKDLAPFDGVVAPGTEVLFTDDHQCDKNVRSCQFRRGHVVRKVKEFYEIQATACRGINGMASLTDRLASRTAIESKAVFRQGHQMLSYREDETDVWRGNICYGAAYADKTRDYEVAVRVRSLMTFPGSCEKYKLTRVSFVPRIRFTIKQDHGKNGRPEYRLISKENNEVILEDSNAIDHEDLKEGHQVLVQDPVQTNIWKLGSPKVFGNKIVVKLQQNPGSNLTIEVTWEDVRRKLRHANCIT